VRVQDGRVLVELPPAESLPTALCNAHDAQDEGMEEAVGAAE
jgi:hypothetical protein